MTFDLKTVLSGMSREEALSRLYNITFDGKKSTHFFINRPNQIQEAQSLGCPSFGGLPENCGLGHRKCWQAAINAYYDEAEPKWAEPEAQHRVKPLFSSTSEEFYGDPLESKDAEIARTNARRKIEAFIAANGGSGDTEIQASFGGKLIAVIIAWHGVGAITCATSELAEEVIRRYTDELRLIAGKEQNHA